RHCRAEVRETGGRWIQGICRESGFLQQLLEIAVGADSAEVTTPPTGDWNADLYDASHSFVWKFGASLVELLAPQAGDRILDLGCGTGHLTAQIAAAGAEVVGFDSSPVMVEQARRAHPAIRFEIGDARTFSFGEG